MRTPSKTSRAAGYAVLVLFVIGGVAFIINDRVGGIQLYDVYPTASMRPTLEVGDLVVVEAAPYTSIHLGDVIVFARPNQGGGCSSEVIVHRVVNVTSVGLITQGDNRFTNPMPDEPSQWPPVPAECVKGVVVLALPFLGKISEAFPPPLNYILVAAIIMLIFMIELFSGKNGEEEASKGEVSSGPRDPADNSTNLSD